MTVLRASPSGLLLATLPVFDVARKGWPHEQAYPPEWG